MNKTTYLIVFLMLPFLTAVQITPNSNQEIVAEQWKEVEITLRSNAEYENPYTDVDVYVVFAGPNDMKLKRPAFWDGENRWKVRFASPLDEGVWEWKSYSSDPDDSGLHIQVQTHWLIKGYCKCHPENEM